MENESGNLGASNCVLISEHYFEKMSSYQCAVSVNMMLAGLAIKVQCFINSQMYIIVEKELVIVATCFYIYI